jgi:dihydroneopterin aldolase
VGDRIYLRGLEVRTILGIEPWEREEPQRVVIDLEIACDAAAASARDAIEDAVNYKSVAKAALAFAQSSRFRLVETLAQRLAEHLMTTCGLPWIRLRVSKPGAIRFSRDVGVEIERGRLP